MTEIYLCFAILLALALVVLLFLFRWVHRCWGKALIAVVFAPLLAVPLGAVSYLAIFFLLRILNWFPALLDVGIPMATLSTLAWIFTTLFMLLLTVHYCREQRHLSTLERGPINGVVTTAPKAPVFWRKFH